MSFFYIEIKTMLDVLKHHDHQQYHHDDIGKPNKISELGTPMLSFKTSTIVVIDDFHHGVAPDLTD